MGDLLQLTDGPSLTLKALYHHCWRASRKNTFVGQDCPATRNGTSLALDQLKPTSSGKKESQEKELL